MVFWIGTLYMVMVAESLRYTLSPQDEPIFFLKK